MSASFLSGKNKFIVWIYIVQFRGFETSGGVVIKP